MFEQASRLKLRFKTPKGILTTEDVWDLTLEQLDQLAKNLNKDLKEQSEESFIKTKTSANKELELKFEIVKHIITVRMAEAEKIKERAEKRKKKQHLLELIAQKENEALSSKSLDDLRKELMELED